MSYERQWSQTVKYALDAHREQVRAKWSEWVPYASHPLWAATTCLQDHKLPDEIRARVATALVIHDLIEDTDQPIPPWIDEATKDLVTDLTCPGGTDEEVVAVWSMSTEVRLARLYDKTSNLADGVWMDDSKREMYEDYVLDLADDVEANYGSLNIVIFARALVSESTV